MTETHRKRLEIAFLELAAWFAQQQLEAEAEGDASSGISAGIRIGFHCANELLCAPEAELEDRIAQVKCMGFDQELCIPGPETH